MFGLKAYYIWTDSLHYLCIFALCLSCLVVAPYFAEGVDAYHVFVDLVYLAEDAHGFVNVLPLWRKLKTYDKSYECFFEVLL